MPAPSNDDFANAMLLSSSGGSIQATNLDATAETPDPLHDAGYGLPTVWFYIAALALPTNLTIGTDAPTSGTPTGDTVMGVYTGASLGALTEIARDDDSGPGFYSQITFSPAPAGEILWIEVTGFSDTDMGNFTLNWSFSAPPSKLASLLWSESHQ